jgi:hypothetical protein
MIDDLIALEAPAGTYAVFIMFHMATEQDVRNEAFRRGKELFYLPDEANRDHATFRDDDSGIQKTFIGPADPR